MTRPLLTALLTTAALALPLTAHAQDSGETDAANTEDEIRVYGRAIEQIGTAQAASEGTVGYDDFEDRPLSRAGELVEVIPGAIATQHSGEGKANQYFLRGFNLDHGTDFSMSIDGVPINMRSHGHGQGYLDINFIIPEIVERIDYRKGPFRASTGDFSAAGSGAFTSYDTLEHNFIDLSVGENGYIRGVWGLSAELTENTNGLIAIEAEQYDGPWELSQDLEKVNGFAKLTHESGPWRFELSATGYDSSWTATDQVPLRAVQSGLIDRFGFIDDDLGGESTRLGLTGSASYDHGDGAFTRATAYVVDYDFTLFSNFTYFAGDPINGDEFEQRDARTYIGGSVVHERPLTDALDIRLGAEARRDSIDELGLYQTASRQRLTTIREDEVTETSLGLWAEADFQLTERLRVLGGVRFDAYDAEVTALSLPVNSGDASDTLVSPSAGLAWRATDNLELYANYGQGFHSNDVRGATISTDPVSGQPVDTVPILVRAEGLEAGARFEQGAFRGTLTVFQLDLDSELVFVGDAGTTEPNDASTRQGVEATLFWQPTDWLVADFSAAYTDAEFDIPGTDTEIPGAVDTVFGGGILVKDGPWSASARLRHFGEAPLIEDGSVTSESTTIVNLGGEYDWRNLTFGLELLNAFDAEDSDITYFFESQLPGEMMPVEDIHFHPIEPRQVRASIRLRY